MTLMDISKKLRHLWRAYGTLNNVVIAVALIIAASWAWGSISMMQTNFSAQKSVDDQQRDLELMQLEVDTLQFQQNYYKSDEYKDLAARMNLGLASPGEKVLLLPKNSDAVIAGDKADAKKETQTSTQSTSQAASNLEQWMNFLVGNNAEVLRQ
jgi:cell division protein FtsB